MTVRATGAAITIGVAVAWFALARGADTDGQEAERQSASSASEDRAHALHASRLEARYRDLERRQDDLRAALDRLAAREVEEIAIEPARDRARPPARPQTEQDRLEATARAIEDTRGVLAPYFEADAREPAWADRTEDEISRFLADARWQEVELDGLECRSRVCRVELAFPDERAMQDFVADASTQHPWKYSAQMFPHDASAPLAVSLYIGRDGVDLPPI